MVTVPVGLMMTTATARRSKLGRILCADPAVCSQTSLLLAMHLVEEQRNEHSHWAYYIGTSTSGWFSSAAWCSVMPALCRCAAANVHHAAVLGT